MTSPLQRRASLIGTPYVGTHTMYGNWESDNAVDLAVPQGTPVYAVAAGTIGTQFGPLDSNDPHLQGLRLHLQAAGDEFYYAHLSSFAPGIAPGAHVNEGQLLGYSGSANGVQHLHFASSAGTPLSYVVGATATMIKTALSRAAAHGIPDTGSAGGGGISFGGVTGAVGNAAGDAAGAVNSGLRHIPGVAQVEGAASATGDALGSVGKFLGTLADPGFWLRALQVIAGAALAGGGLFLLARQVGLATGDSLQGAV